MYSPDICLIFFQIYFLFSSDGGTHDPILSSLCLIDLVLWLVLSDPIESQKPRWFYASFWLVLILIAFGVTSQSFAQFRMVYLSYPMICLILSGLTCVIHLCSCFISICICYFFLCFDHLSFYITCVRMGLFDIILFILGVKKRKDA